MQNNIAHWVFIVLAHSIFDIIAFTAQVIKFRDISLISELPFVKLFTAMFINKMTLSSEDHPAMLINTAALLVNEESFVCHHHTWLSIYVVEISHQVVRVEVEFLNAVGSGYFTFIINIFFREHHLLLHAVKDVSCFRISEITSSRSWISLTVLVVSILISKHNNVTFFITVEITEDIVLIEKTVLPIRWLFQYGVRLSSKIFECITFYFHCIIVNRVSWHRSRFC